MTKSWAASGDVQISKRGEGMLCRCMNSRAKAFEPSISAAARLGQKMLSPRRWNSSAMPSTIGSSGPTTVRSAPIVCAKSASSTMLEVSIGTQSAWAAVPAFPGAQKSSVTRGLWRIFQARACSRPPFPTTRTFIKWACRSRSLDASDLLSTDAILAPARLLPLTPAVDLSSRRASFRLLAACASRAVHLHRGHVFPPAREPPRHPRRLLDLCAPAGETVNTFHVDLTRIGPGSVQRQTAREASGRWTRGRTPTTCSIP